MKRTLVFALLLLTVNLMSQNLKPQNDLQHQSLVQNAVTKMKNGSEEMHDIFTPHHDYNTNIHRSLVQSLSIQLIDSVWEWRWDTVSMHWLEYYKLIDIIYNAENLPGSYIQKMWNGAAWFNYIKYIITYDANGNTISEVEQTWHSLAWENDFQSSYTYDAHNNLTSQLFQSWNGSMWENGVQFTYVYDVHDNQTYGLIQTWDNDAWENDSQYTNVYDINDNLLIYTVQSWSGTDWENAGQNVLTYDLNNNQLTNTTQNWDGANWLDLIRLVSTYDAGNNQITGLIQYWYGLDWVDNNLSTYTYDTNHNRTSELAQIWSGVEWTNSDQITYSYNSNNDLTSEFAQGWNGSLWVNDYRNTFTFDAGYFPVSEVNITFKSDGQGIADGDSIYYYSIATSATKEHTGGLGIISIYPNPGDGLFTLSTDGQISQVDIYNSLGERIYSDALFRDQSSGIIDLRFLAKGIYIIHLSDGLRIYNRKIVIQ